MTNPGLVGTTTQTNDRGFEVNPAGTLSTEGLISYWPLTETVGPRRDIFGNNHVYVTNPYAAYDTDLQYGGDSDYPASAASTLHPDERVAVMAGNNVGTSSSDGQTNRDRCLSTSSQFPYHVAGVHRGYSMAGWVYVNYAYLSGGFGVIAGPTNGDGNDGFTIFQKNVGGDQRLACYHANNNQGDAGLNSTVNLSTSTWYFVCSTWLESTAARTITVNETTTSETLSGTYNGTGVTDTTWRFCLGRQAHDGYTWTWNGSLSHWSFWERALKADEITALYNGGKPNRLAT